MDRPRRVSIDMAPHCWVSAVGALPIQGKLGMVLCGSATPSQGYQKRVRRGCQRALSFQARRTRFELAGVLTHMVRCHVGHCTSRTIVPRLCLTRRSRSPKYAWWKRRHLFSSRHHWCISFAPSTGLHISTPSANCQNKFGVFAGSHWFPGFRKPRNRKPENPQG